MNVFRLSAFLLFLTTVANAQSNWAPIGASWTYRFMDSLGDTSRAITITSVGDTIIQGKQCRILRHNKCGCDKRCIEEYTYSDSGKVYFLSKKPDFGQDVFQLLFNINAKAGDHVNISYPLLSDSIVTVVDSVSTININGAQLKKLIVHVSHQPPNLYAFSGEIIENIGHTRYLFPWIYNSCNEYLVGPLRCYSDSVIGAYTFSSGYNCTTGFTSYPSNDGLISIFPNPNNGKILLIWEDIISPASLLIYNILGEEVYSTVISDKKTQLDLSRFSKEMYFLTLQTEKKKTPFKIIIQ